MLSFLCHWWRDRTLHRQNKPRAAHLITGNAGETIAARYLLHIGYDVTAQNIRVGRHDEIDLIAFDPEDRVMVFAEVKSFSAASPWYHPEIMVRSEKRRNMQRAARRWMTQHRYDGGYRLDVVCVAGSTVVDHYKEISV